MRNADVAVPPPVNEPVLAYAPGSPERAALDAEVARQRDETIEIPVVVGGERIETGDLVEAVCPHDHGHVLAKVHRAGEAEIRRAIDAAIEARREWCHVSPETRAAVFLRAAEIVTGPARMALNAATMLNQSKTCHQAEIEAACEQADFYRFNCAFMQEIYASMQPPVSPAGTWNVAELRALEGFVYAASPFNFTAIAGNLPHAPALMGNAAVWKPSDHSLFSNWHVFEVFEAAGLPDGVINFVPGDPALVTKVILEHPEFAGIHYTGSTQVFRSIWHRIGANLDRYRSYPRIVGETGGKDFIVAHESADPDALVVAMIRGAYEYQGQKCSAASRCYVPATLWAGIRDRLIEEIRSIPMGDPTDHANFMGAVIHRAAFDRCRGYIERAQASPDCEVLVGGGCDDSKGYFVEPTLLLAKRPDYETMQEEIFGPINTVFVYDDAEYEEILDLCDRTSPYALTGAVFAEDRMAIELAHDRLNDAAGNFYVNDKPTGAIVGQQPFGGARASGTNDKAGSALNLLRWCSMRTIKETFVPPTEWRYPYMGG